MLNFGAEHKNIFGDVRIEGFEGKKMPHYEMTIQDPPAVAQGYEVVRIQFKLREEPERLFMVDGEVLGGSAQSTARVLL